MSNAVNQPPSEPVPICIEIDVDVPLLLSGVEVLLLLVLKKIPLHGDDVILPGPVLALPHLVELGPLILLSLRVLCLA